MSAPVVERPRGGTRTATAPRTTTRTAAARTAVPAAVPRPRVQRDTARSRPAGRVATRPV